MVTLASLTPAAMAARLQGEGLRLRTGPFGFCLHSRIPAVAEGLLRLYDHMPLLGPEELADFTVSVLPGRGVRRWVRPQACFEFDGQRVFEPLPEGHAYALLEWAMNWCISAHAHQYLIVHAAVLERGGMALVMPAPPGSGKSTLCAALALSGWRLLSDELALLDLSNGLVWPLCRPISLKNRSIDIVRALSHVPVFSRVVEGTTKGSVAHMRVSDAAVAQMDLPARPGWVVFPRYAEGAPTRLTSRARAGTVIELSRNCFNIGVLGQPGFHALVDWVAASGCYDFRYSRLTEALECFDQLARRGADHPAATPALQPGASSVVSGDPALAP